MVIQSKLRIQSAGQLMVYVCLKPCNNNRHNKVISVVVCMTPHQTLQRKIA